MPKQFPEVELAEIIEAVNRYPEGACLQDIGGNLKARLPARTLLQYRLQSLTSHNRLVKIGDLDHALWQWSYENSKSP